MPELPTTASIEARTVNHIGPILASDQRRRSLVNVKLHILRLKTRSRKTATAADPVDLSLTGDFRPKHSLIRRWRKIRD